MDIGFIGLGKLGLPVALAIEERGHKVCGYDINPAVEEILQTRRLPYLEVHAQELLDNTSLQFGDIPYVVEHSEIIFVPVQTPHDRLYECVTRLP